MRGLIFRNRCLKTCLLIASLVATQVNSVAAESLQPRIVHLPGPKSYASIHGIDWVKPDELWITRSDKTDGPAYLEIWDAKTMVRKSLLLLPGFGTERQVFESASKAQFVTGYDSQENFLLWRSGSKQSSNLGVQFWSSSGFKRCGEDFIVGVSNHKAQLQDATLLPLITWKLEKTLTKSAVNVRAPQGFCFVCGGNYEEADTWFDMSPDGSLGATALYSTAVKCDSDLLYQNILIFDGNSGKPLRTLKVANADQLIEFTFMPDGRLALLKNLLLKGNRSSKDTIQIWNPQAGIPSFDFQQDVERLVFTFSPDGSLLATGGQKTIQLWNTQTGKLLRELKMPEQRNWRAFFSPDSSTLATFDGYHELIFWPLG